MVVFLCASTHTHTSLPTMTLQMVSTKATVVYEGQLWDCRVPSKPELSCVIRLEVRNSNGICLRVSFAFPSALWDLYPEASRIHSLYSDATDSLSPLFVS